MNTQLSAQDGDNQGAAGFGEGGVSDAGKIKMIRIEDGAGRPTSQFWAIFERRGHGVCEFNLNCGDDKVNSVSQVMASVTEIHGVTGKPVMAPASMEVWNVTPLDSGVVQVRMNVQWHEHIPFRINLIILN